MSAAIEIFLDLSKPNAAIVKGLSDPSAAAFDDWLQYSQVPLIVYLVQPTGNVISPPFFSQVDNAGMSLKCYVGPRPGPDAILASQEVFATVAGPDSAGRVLYFAATLNLNDTRLNAALTGDSLSSYLEFHLNRGDGVGFVPVAQIAITVEAGVHDPGSAVTPATPTEIENLRAELYAWASANFVSWRNDLIPANAGRNVVLNSPDASRTRELGVANDGSPIDNAS